MYEVKVFNKQGDLKKVISVKTLKKRMDEQMQSPSLYRNNRKKIKPAAPVKIEKRG